MPKRRSVGHRAYSRAKDNRSSLSGPLMIENNTVFSEGARAYSPDYLILMRIRGCAVLYLGIT